jgi:hypothetical protein
LCSHLDQTDIPEAFCKRLSGVTEGQHINEVVASKCFQDAVDKIPSNILVRSCHRAWIIHKDDDIFRT